MRRARPETGRRRLDAGAAAGREDAAVGSGGGLQRAPSGGTPRRGSGDGRQRRATGAVGRGSSGGRERARARRGRRRLVPCVHIGNGSTNPTYTIFLFVS
jgi:hypothetical protein